MSSEPSRGQDTNPSDHPRELRETSLIVSPTRRLIGLILAPTLGVAIYLLIPEAIVNEDQEVISGLAKAGRVVAGVAGFMATLWVTEAIPISATALVPIVLFPLLTGGVVSVPAATAPYASKYIFLFMGGFFIAKAMERWNLHKRIALHTILLFGTKPDRLVAGFMVATAGLSMWVSNTATTVMMLPIALSVVALIRTQLAQSDDPHKPAAGEPFPLAICLMLGIAYSASIGGIGTLIGTPPNLFLAGFMLEEFGLEISFARWLVVGLPLVIVFLPCVWIILTKLVYPIRIKEIPGGRALIHGELEKQGPMSRAEKMVLAVFVCTAAAWITRSQLVKLELPSGLKPFAGLDDTVIAIGAALLLFLIPVDWKRGVALLSWKQAATIPWGILILFGGGMSLAEAIKTSGVAQYIGQSVAGLEGIPTVAIVLVVTTMVIFLTELTSNIATTAALLPILAPVAIGLDVNPVMLIVPTALAASCAFMMPIATPPNAIVFGSGELTIPQMCKAGIWLNLLGIIFVMLLMYGVVVGVLGGQIGTAVTPGP